jgi:glycyl-tRNA synthetase beta chain
VLSPSPEGEGLSTAELAVMAERAARLCKADLVTGMVGEFPELQGIMGGYYARAQGDGTREADAVADAVRDHYKPVGQGDDLPTAPVTVAVSLADKLDTVFQFFSIGAAPTGSKDPYALRRAGLGIIAVVRANELRLSLIFAALESLMQNQVLDSIREQQNKRAAVLNAVLEELGPEAAIGLLKGWVPTLAKTKSLKAEIGEASFQLMMEMLPTAAAVRDFLVERLEVSSREAGTPVDIFRAARAVNGGREDDLVRLLARVKALQAFVGTDEGANLLAGYKRAANILKQAGGDAIAEGTVPSEAPWTVPGGEGEGSSPNGTVPIRGQSPAEVQLLAFFDGVMVNDPDPDKRAFRLGLLARFRDAVHRVADFSRIEG